MDTVFAINIPHISLPAEELFRIGPLPITNSNLQMLLVMIGLCIFFILVARKLALIPGRRQAVAELAVEGLFNFAAGTSGSRALARRIFPPHRHPLHLHPRRELLRPPSRRRDDLHHEERARHGRSGQIIEAGGTDPPADEPDGTQYLRDEEVPIFRAPNSDLNMTLAMALIVFVVVEYMGLRAHGVGGFIKELFTPWWLGPIHIVGELARIISLSFRLFGNIFGGEVLVTMMYALTYVIVPTVFLGVGTLLRPHSGAHLHDSDDRLRSTRGRRPRRWGTKQTRRSRPRRITSDNGSIGDLPGVLNAPGGQKWCGARGNGATAGRIQEGVNTWRGM